MAVADRSEVIEVIEVIGPPLAETRDPRRRMLITDLSSRGVLIVSGGVGAPRFPDVTVTSIFQEVVAAVGGVTDLATAVALHRALRGRLSAARVAHHRRAAQGARRVADSAVLLLIVLGLRFDARVVLRFRGLGQGLHHPVVQTGSIGPCHQAKIHEGCIDTDPDQLHLERSRAHHQPGSRALVRLLELHRVTDAAMLGLDQANGL